MTARENVVPVLLEKVYQLIQDKLELSHQPLVTKLAQHLFSNIADDDLIQRNESDLYGAVVSLWHHINEKKPEDISVRVFNRLSAAKVGNQLTLLLKLLYRIARFWWIPSRWR